MEIDRTPPHGLERRITRISLQAAGTSLRRRHALISARAHSNTQGGKKERTSSARQEIPQARLEPTRLNSTNSAVESGRRIGPSRSQSTTRTPEGKNPRRTTDSSEESPEKSKEWVNTLVGETEDEATPGAKSALRCPRESNQTLAKAGGDQPPQPYNEGSS